MGGSCRGGSRCVGVGWCLGGWVGRGRCRDG